MPLSSRYSNGLSGWIVWSYGINPKAVIAETFFPIICLNIVYYTNTYGMKIYENKYPVRDQYSCFNASFCILETLSTILSLLNLDLRRSTRSGNANGPGLGMRL
jgi:hypothetical protein